MGQTEWSQNTRSDGDTVSAASYVYPRSECAKYLDLPIHSIQAIPPYRTYRRGYDEYMFVYYELLNALPLNMLCNERKIKTLCVNLEK
jgi:hypothetical protein